MISVEVSCLYLLRWWMPEAVCPDGRMLHLTFVAEASIFFCTSVLILS